MSKPIKIKALPCPFCGGTNLHFTYEMHYGHGDSGFDRARIECEDCCGSKGGGFNYGTPTIDDEFKAWEQWNTRKNAPASQKTTIITIKENDIDLDAMYGFPKNTVKKMYEKYGDISLIEFFKIYTKNDKTKD